MKQVFKKNQIIITALALMIAVGGYMTFSGKMSPASSGQNTNEQQETVQDDTYDSISAGHTSQTDEAGLNNNLLSENTAMENATGEDGLIDVYVPGEEDSDGVAPESSDGEPANTQTGSDEAANYETPGTAVLTSGVAFNDYIATIRLSREQVHAASKEALLEIVNNEEIAEELKQDAINGLVQLTKNAEYENNIETLLSAKGFEHSIVTITENGCDVVVCTIGEITDAERAQIEDIVTRSSDITVDRIVITVKETR